MRKRVVQAEFTKLVMLLYIMENKIMKVATNLLSIVTVVNEVCDAVSL